jgi:HTH-type transcriptional regulator/antitoxin HipB
VKTTELNTFSNPRELGAACRERRKKLRLTLQDAAGAAGVTIRFASELERGKETASIGKALNYAQMLGLTLYYAQPEED